MAISPGFIGDVRKGDRVQFAIDNSANNDFNATHFSVYDNDSKELVLADQPLTEATDSETYIRWVDFEISDSFDTDGTRLYTWVEGRCYAVIVKSKTGLPNTDSDFFVVNFRIEPQERRAFLGVVEKGKNLYFLHREENRDAMFYDVIDPRDGNAVFSNVAMVGPMGVPGGQRFWAGNIETEGTDDLAVGRTYWVRVKDIAAEDPNLDALYSFTVLPRLEYDLARLLAYNGENTVMDSFTYDQAGNVTGLRVRIFSNAADAANATQGVTDPEPGEIAALRVTQEHNVPRNVRTFHSSVLEFLSSTYPRER